MATKIRSKLSYANVIATAALFLALGGGAYALSGVPDSAGVFHGCVSNKTGVLRVVKKSSSCKKSKTVTRHGKKVKIPGETAITWNQKGSPGPAGVQGVQGVTGASGATKVVVRHAVNTSNSTTMDVNCAAGEVATGGGASLPGGSNLVYSRPMPDGLDDSAPKPTGWSVASSTLLGPGNIHALVVCASP
jgi:hypothetical protein